MEENTENKTTNDRSKMFNKVLAGALAVFVVFSVGFAFGQNSIESGSKTKSLDFSDLFNQDREVGFSMIEDVWNLINQKYVGIDETDRQKLIFGAINGMIDSLDDPYTTFFDQKETEEFKSSVSGKFEGVGIEISTRDENLVVVSPLKNTPAHKAGVRAGDVIVEIDDTSAIGITLEEAVSKIRGPKGSTVVLTVQREGESSNIDIPIVRDTIEVPSVEWELIEGNIAYIELSHFSEQTSRDFSKIAQEVIESDADRIVLDLRNNPGGYLDQAIKVAGWFIDTGKVVVIEESGDQVRRNHNSPGPGSLGGFPIVVLQNQGSASAAEILAGALLDHKNTPIVGETSFGKGSVQEFEDLPGNTSIKITVALWLTPNGHQINDKGIEPTIKIETAVEDLENDIDRQKDKAIEVVKEL